MICRNCGDEYGSASYTSGWCAACDCGLKIRIGGHLYVRADAYRKPLPLVPGPDTNAHYDVPLLEKGSG